MDYVKDPAAIYKRSFAMIDAEVDFAKIPAAAHAIARRIIHACGMVEIVDDLIFSEDFAATCQTALKNAAPIFVDVEMVRHGIIERQIKTGNTIICTLNDPRAKEIGLAKSITRSAAATELWVPHLAGSIVVIGNAPTALFALLEMIDEGAPKPAAIIGFPVGFVGAAESKQELAQNSRGIAFATLKGRKGGSAMAASVINALTVLEQHQ
jgi:precorrin-8X/cobalt-precorrin-8 methylmutase